MDEAGKEPYRANADMMLAELGGPHLPAACRLPAQDQHSRVVLHGDVSHPAFTAIARTLAIGLPHARLQLVEGSGHIIYAE